MSHSPTCATGARAELRGPCDCGAVDKRRWRIRPMQHAGGDRVEVEVDGPLSTDEAMEMALALQHMTIVVARKNIARKERGR